MLKYEKLSKEVENQICKDRLSGKTPSVAFKNEDALRRTDADKPSLIRPAFIRDIDKIMHCQYYNRYADKTQVFSFYKNDDITRRMLHIQLVSRIARTIGKALGLNLDLIEAIALGHDIGHTPFGHAGEEYLDELFYENAKRHFSHNIHSVRVLDGIFPLNITLQTLNGIASHDGEMELCEYRPKPLDSFLEYDRQIESCYIDKANVKKLLTPCTLEGCVVRISDIIAYLGKDRQDAQRADVTRESAFESGAIGSRNAEIINNLTVNIVENSYGKDYIKMDSEHFLALKTAKSDNYKMIYRQPALCDTLDNIVRPMMRDIYQRLLTDLESKNLSSPIFTHHINIIEKSHYKREKPYFETENNQIVVDYIASMTDDYFIDLHHHLFPQSSLTIKYKGYFDK